MIPSLKKHISTMCFVLLIFTVLILTACGSGTLEPVMATRTIKAMLRTTESFKKTAATPTRTSTSRHLRRTATSTSLPTLTTVPHHITRPDSYNGAGSYTIWDSDSSTTAALHRPQGGDYFGKSMYERPFSANSQEIYYPQVDIINTAMLNARPWVYGSITLKGVNPESGGMDATYALEFDVDVDGRGDTLILVDAPSNKDWSTDGVQVWYDSNKDIGHQTPAYADPPQTGDGYDQLVFDQGQGTDPDLAWARISDNNAGKVLFAFKPSLIQDSEGFLWSAWAEKGGLHPEWFDYNDHFTYDQAGSPLPGSEHPLKALAAMDNTCRWSIGFAPSSYEPGLCLSSITPANTPTITPSGARKYTSTPTP
jgi:hypothetical protein